MQIEDVVTFLMIFGFHMNILFMIKVEILVLIKHSNMSSQIMLIIESTMVIIFRAFSPIIF